MKTRSISANHLTAKELPLPIELVTSACCLPELDRAQLYAAAARAGYSGVELFCGWGPSRALPGEDTPATLTGRGVRVTAIHLPADPGQARQAIGLAATAGVPQVIAHAHAPAADAGTWLRPLVQEARAKGVDLVVTNHKGQGIESPDDMALALERCGSDAPGVLIEAGHYWLAGHDARAAFLRFRECVRLVHIKDLDPQGNSVPYGTGVSPLAEFLSELAQAGYAGRVVAELELKGATSAETEGHLAAGLPKIAAWLGLVGVSSHERNRR